MLRVPGATYRLQFNPNFTFNDAREIAPYLASLGITDIYASPILRARKGSQHGYDVVDAASLNPELGSDDEFNALHEELTRNDLGFLLDVVPNHMAASPENAWWMSVLENGPHSRFFHYFDIDSSPKVLLAILGRPYGEAVESQEIKLNFDHDGFFFTYYDHRLPLAAESYRIVLRECVDALPREGVAFELRELTESEEAVANSKFLKETVWRIYEQDAQFRDALEQTITRFNGEPGNPESFDALDALLDAQWYRLAYWRIASEKINYRRFFDVTDLIGVRVENPEVFEARNRRTFELIAEGKVTGLRLDHIDGLYDPIGHMKKLQTRIGDDSFYVIVEKILTDGETLPQSFAVSGTTGYDFLATVNNLFIDGKGLAQLDDFYRSFTGCTRSFAEVSYEKKKQVIHELFPGEMRALGKQLAAIAMTDRNARDFAPTELAAALTEITACLHVYRTYIRDADVSDADRDTIKRAVACARAHAGASLDQRMFTFLERMLLNDPPLPFVQRWQQFTGRVMAKGVEDTAFYNYNRLVSLNEVGSEPGRDPDRDGLAEFHRRNERIARDWPDTLNATSTHDTKRSEDVRARINVLSEIAPAWASAVRRWSKIVPFPDPNVALMIYQNLIGAWPIDRDRLHQFLEKALREAKTQTSWIDPNHDYERSVLAFADALLSNETFIASFERLQRRVAYFGFINSLAQLVLKITSPGVPDFYQGTELWDFSLVDPDNRRPVDYAARRRLADEIRNAEPAALLRNWSDGRVKMFTMIKALDVRRRYDETFRRGAYRAIDAGEHVCAFARGDDVVVAVPRLVAGGMPQWTLDDTWRNELTGESGASDVFAKFPVAILTRVR